MVLYFPPGRTELMVYIILLQHQLADQTYDVMPDHASQTLRNVYIYIPDTAPTEVIAALRAIPNVGIALERGVGMPGT